MDMRKAAGLAGPGVNGAAIVALTASILSGQEPSQVGIETTRVNLDVMTNHAEGQQRWRTSRAWLQLSFQRTAGYVRVTNVSAITFDSARFFAEYYDESKRLCFTLAFVQDRNLDGLRGSFQPGETRQLSAVACVAPAMGPREVRLWFLGEAGSSRLMQPEIIAPHGPQRYGWRIGRHSDWPGGGPTSHAVCARGSCNR